MFFYNLHRQWDLFKGAKPHGTIFHPIGFDQVSAYNRSFPKEFPEIKLFDPNIYFWKLELGKCARACSKIATYDYVPIEVPEFDKEEHKRIKVWLEKKVNSNIKNVWPPCVENEQEIKECIEKCLKFQEYFGVYRLILPSPHIYEVSDNLTDFLQWLDSGLKIGLGYETPLLVSVSISDICLSQHYETILDHITARENVKGIYISIEKSVSGSLAPDNYDVAKSLLDISYIIGNQKNLEVFVNFADVFGLACLAVGATAFATGYELKSKCLDFEQFIEKEGRGGGAYPRFFSLSTTKMYQVKDDLNKIRDKRLLRFFEKDRTQHSSPLFGALEAGQDHEAVPTWRQQRNNLASARSHFIESLKTAADHVKSIEDFKEKIRWGLAWLQDAETKDRYFDSIFEEDKLKADGGNIKVWRSAFESLIVTYKLI